MSNEEKSLERKTLLAQPLPSLDGREAQNSPLSNLELFPTVTFRESGKSCFQLCIHPLVTP